MLKGGFAEFHEKFGEEAVQHGLITINRPDLNRSCQGYTKMKERPSQQYWLELQEKQRALGLDLETLERQTAEL